MPAPCEQGTLELAATAVKPAEVGAGQKLDEGSAARTRTAASGAAGWAAGRRERLRGQCGCSC